MIQLPSQLTEALDYICKMPYFQISSHSEVLGGYELEGGRHYFIYYTMKRDAEVCRKVHMTDGWPS